MSSNKNINVTSNSAIDKKNQPFPLLPMQEAYLIARNSGQCLSGISTQPYFEIDFEELDINRAEQVWNLLIERHEMLRATFNVDGEQMIREDLDHYSIDYHDLTKVSKELKENNLLSIRNEMFSRTLPMTGPLFDIKVTKIGNTIYRVHFVLDMLVSDLSGLVLLFSEFGLLYSNLQYPLQKINYSFRDYVLDYKNKIEKSEEYSISKQYWIDRLHKFSGPPDLPRVSNQPPASKQRFIHHEYILSPNEWRTIKSWASEAGVSPTVFLVTAFSEVLGKWSKTSKFAINLTMMNRLPLHNQVNELLGDFTSNILLEVDSSDHIDFKTRARLVQDQLRRDIKYSKFSGVEFIREIAGANGGGKAQLMDVVFTSYLRFTDSFKKNNSWLGDDTLSTAKWSYYANRTPSVAIDHQICEMIDGSAAIWWDAVDEVFPEKMIDDMFQSYQRLLKGYCKTNSDDVVQVELLPQNQKELRDRLNSQKEMLSDELLHTLFTRQAHETPSSIAIESGEITLTYKQVDDWSSIVAHDLERLGSNSNQLIAINMHKGWEQIVACLAVLKSGAAYIPIDTDLPMRRINELLAMSECTTVLVQAGYTAKINKKFNTVVVDQTLKDLPPVESRPIKQSQTDIAYVIFTSGSTGKPKGVAIEHRGAVNTVLDINRRFKVSSKDSVFSLSSLSFDLSVYDIFGILAAGGKIVVPLYSDVKRQDTWMNYIQKYNITIWNSVPALMKLLVDENRIVKSDALKKFNLIMLSGDWIPISLPSELKGGLSKNCRIISLGGATEVSIWSIFYEITEESVKRKTIPYGKPLTNQSLYVLDKSLKSCPDWVVGDLYIGGVGVAKGYWRDPEKTSKSFIYDDYGQRLYRTGDRGRYIEDGNIEIIGREDNQVKIQGYRVELGEIEANISEHENIRSSIVVATESNGAKVLVAYLVSNSSRQERIIHKRYDTDAKLVTRAYDNKEKIILTQKGIRNFSSSLLRTYINKFKVDVIEDLSNFSGYWVFVGLLDRLKQKEFAGRAIPKYLYPSASSLYPVQLYLYFKKGLHGILPGFYYYYARENSLILLNHANLIDKEIVENDSECRLYWVADSSVMSAVYEQNLAKKLLFLEAGYISYLLSEGTEEIGINLESKWFDQDYPLSGKYFSSSHMFLGVTDVMECASDIKSGISRKISSSSGKFIESFYQNPSYNVLQRQSFRYFEGGSVSLEELSNVLDCLPIYDGLNYYLYVQGDRVADLSKNFLYRYCTSTKIFKKILHPGRKTVFSLYNEENRQILDRAGFALYITLSPELMEKKRSFWLVTAGEIGQNLMSSCWQFGIGLCPVGELSESQGSTLLTKERVLHSFIGGSLARNQLEYLQHYEKPIRGNPSKQELETFLRSRLPLYMVPAAFIYIDKLPLTSTGKVNRKALPDPVFEDNANVHYVAPSTKTEKLLADVFQSQLGLEKLGVYDNFFDIGINSLVSMKICSRLRKSYSLDVPLRLLFEYPTVMGLAKAIDSDSLNTISNMSVQNFDIYAARNNYIELNNITDVGFPITFAQRQLFAHEQISNAKSTYNIFMYAELDDIQKLNVLRESIDCLFSKHEILNVRFRYYQGNLRQYIIPGNKYYISTLSAFQKGDIERQRELEDFLGREANEPIDLLAESPIRFSFLSLAIVALSLP